MKDGMPEAAATWESKLIVAGLGGQGVVFATRLLANTALSLGYPVLASETHGMSQRGGSVISHLKIGGTEAPLIRKGTADILIALDANEAWRNLPYLKRGGNAFVNIETGLPEDLNPHIERLGFQIRTLPASQIALELGTATVANVALLGFAAAHPILGLSYQALQETLTKASSKRLETNLKALEAGFRQADEALLASTDEVGT